MWGFIKGLFGGSSNNQKVVETAADGIYNGLDKLIYTAEEKADALAEGRNVFLKFVDKAYDQNSIRSVTRRWLAFMVVGPTMLDVLILSIFYVIAPFMQKFDELGAAMYNPFSIAGDNLLAVVTLVAPWAGGVLIFYFGPHLIGAFRPKPQKDD